MLCEPIAKTKTLKNHLKTIPAENFHTHWAGYATTRGSYEMGRSTTGAMSMFVQRFGERPDEYKFNSFLCTDDRDELDALTLNYPKRWHIPRPTSKTTTTCLGKLECRSVRRKSPTRPAR